MFKTTFAALVVATAAFIGTAQAQTVDTLAESMRQSITRCSNNDYSSQIFTDQQCVKVQFSALQTYIDAASACIKQSTTANPATLESCKEAKIIEQSLIKTFQPPKTAKK